MDTNGRGTRDGGTRVGAEVVTEYLERFDGDAIAAMGLDRVVSEPPGLDLAGICAALADPRLTEPGRQPVALHMMCDFMAPSGSIYYDAIYGDFHGQQAIRQWLVPVMATIDFVEFVPTAPAALFDDGEGGTSLDEWQMFAAIGDDRLPLSRGVSVRRWRDGWLTWACDVYDTGPFRVPPPPEALDGLPDGADAPEPLPDPPTTTWEPTGGEPEVASSLDPAAVAATFHPTDSVFHDPVAGELRGREAIGTWLTGRLAELGDAAAQPLGPRLDATDEGGGSVSVQEWILVHPDRPASPVRGTSVRRRDADGLVVSASDYYDTAT